MDSIIKVPFYLQQETHMNAMMIDPKDNVAVAIEPIRKGEEIVLRGGAAGVTATEEITIYHKVAVRPIAKGEPVVKYGEHIVGYHPCPSREEEYFWPGSMATPDFCGYGPREVAAWRAWLARKYGSDAALNEEAMGLLLKNVEIDLQ